MKALTMAAYCDLSAPHKRGLPTAPHEGRPTKALRVRLS